MAKHLPRLACEMLALTRGPSSGLEPSASAKTEGFNRRHDHQRKFSGSYSVILALIQLFELWKSLTAFPGPTSSSRRARS